MVVAFLMHNPFYKEGINTKTGNYNGYVAFKDNVSLSYLGSLHSNIEIVNYLDEFINVHGGITFDGSIYEDDPIIPLTVIPEDIYSYRVIGFDTCHYGDNSEEWSFKRTKEETLNLKKQIENLIKQLK